MVVLERLLTHGEQTAHSNMDVNLNGKDAAVQIISRSVAKDQSVQVFHPKAIGNDACRAHVQCDSIIMDDAKVSSIPEITANHADAQIVHEAAIGRINNDQLIKLQTFGLEEAGSGKRHYPGIFEIIYFCLKGSDRVQTKSPLRKGAHFLSIFG